MRGARRRLAGAAEGLAAGAAGAGLAWGALAALGLEGLAAWGAGAAGLNGLISGAAGVYDWRRMRGWLCFGLDSTWGLAGTAAGVALHAVDLCFPARSYLPEMSRRNNRHVYEGGFTFRPGFVLALGNVVSRGGGRQGAGGLRGGSPPAVRRRKLVAVHEGVHLFQNRAFGPLYVLGYAAWMTAAGAAGLAVGLASRRSGGRIWPVVETFAYYNNPFEYQAYRKDENWPPSGAHPRYAWGARRRAQG